MLERGSDTQQSASFQCEVNLPSQTWLYQEKGKDKKMSIAVGPWGGNGGDYWDDGVYNGVREIYLTYDHCIDSIQVVYDNNGKSVTADKHGGVGGTYKAEIKLQYPEEFLTSVTGHYFWMVHGIGQVVRSISFKSNKRTFGPYGIEHGTPFTFSTDGALFVGLKGRSGWYLDSIGFHLIPGQTPKQQNKVQARLKRFMRSSPRSAIPNE